MSTQPTPGTEELTGPLAETVGQIRQTAVPPDLGQGAMRRAAAMNAPWTPKRVAAWSGIAAAIVGAAFLSGIAMIHWTQPHDVPPSVARDDGKPEVKEVAQAAPEAQVESQDPMTRFQQENRRIDASIAELDVQRARLEADRAKVRAETMDTLAKLRSQYEAAGKSAEAAAMAQQLASLGGNSIDPNVVAFNRRLNDANPNVFTLQQPAMQPAGGVENLMNYHGMIGQSVTVNAVGSSGGSVWGGGKGIYTLDSSLGAAAVHAGVLKDGERATLRVSILPGQPSYDGSTQNGVTSTAWGQFDGSFHIDAKMPIRAANGTLIINGGPNGTVNLATPPNQNATLNLKVNPGVDQPIVITGPDGNNLRVLTIQGGTLQLDTPKQKAATDTPQQAPAGGRP